MHDLTVESAGVPLAVRDFGGTGKAVVLLHGLGRTLVDWSVMAPLVRPHFRTVAFDLRGHGQSGDGPWSWEQSVADIEAVATQLSLGTPDVVGHSLLAPTRTAHNLPDTSGGEIHGSGTRHVSRSISSGIHR
jgi:pimeloyl-ACP methyl ester carboxylesterase